MPRLTKRLIDAAAAPTAGDVMLWDDDLPGFGVRIKPSGARSFVVQYRNSNGRSRRLTLGRYGVLTPDQGRALARDRLSDVARGIDPAEDRRAGRQALTIAELCRDYFEKAKKGLIITRRGGPKKSATLSVDRGRIDRHIIPLLGHRPVKDVTSTDVRSFLRDVTAGRTAADIKTGWRGRARITGGQSTATRTLGLLGGIFTYAVEEGHRPDNPTVGVKRARDRKREFRLNESGYRRLGLRIRAARRAGVRQHITDLIWLIALTGCRRGELQKLTRSEVDLAGSALRLGDTKTGKSIRPIGRAAVVILAKRLDRISGKYVFPALKGAGYYRNFPNAWGKVVGRRIPDLKPHGLRHSFASVAEDLGFTMPTISALLGHAGVGVTAGYIHKLDAALIGAANRVSDHIEGLMLGAAAPNATNVVELSQRSA